MSRHHNMVNHKFFGYILSDHGPEAVKFIKKESVKTLRRDGKETVLEALTGMFEDFLEDPFEHLDDFMSEYEESMRLGVCEREDDFSEISPEYISEEEDLDDFPGFGTHYDPIKDPGPPNFEYRLDRDLCSLFPDFTR